MTRNTAFFLFALCPLIPVTAHFAWGLIIASSFLYLFVAGIMFRELINQIGAGDIGPYIELSALAVSSSVLYLIFRSFSPVLSVSLGMYFFLSSVSYLMLVSVDRFSFKTPFTGNILLFIPFILLFSAIRELMGFGMLTLPIADQLTTIFVLPFYSYYGIPFWGTAGGALILLGLITWLFKYVTRRASTAARNR